MNAQELVRYADSYLLSRETCAVYARQIRSRCQAFADWLGDAEISAEALNRFLLTVNEGRKPITVRGYRTAVLSVLTFAGWKPESRVRSVRVIADNVECFTAEEILAQIKAAKRMKGALPNGVSYSDFWTLALTAGYGVALRQGDLLAVQVADIAEDGTYVLRPSKTERFGKVLTVRFPALAMQLIRQHGQGRAIPWPFTAEHFRQEFSALLIAAGVRRGSWRWLRRSAGTFAEIANPGSGHRLLGNSQKIFTRHYDASAYIDPRPIMPPPLVLPIWRRLFSWLFPIRFRRGA